MKQAMPEQEQPWASCFLTDILISYMQETLGESTGIDYPGLFRGIEGLRRRPIRKDS